MEGGFDAGMMLALLFKFNFFGDGVSDLLRSDHHHRASLLQAAAFAHVLYDAAHRRLGHYRHDYRDDYEFFLSFIGAAVALVCTLILKYMRFTSTVTETVIISPLR